MFSTVVSRLNEMEDMLHSVEEGSVENLQKKIDVRCSLATSCLSHHSSPPLSLSLSLSLDLVHVSDWLTGHLLSGATQPFPSLPTCFTPSLFPLSIRQVTRPASSTLLVPESPPPPPPELFFRCHPFLFPQRFPATPLSSSLTLSVATQCPTG